MSDDRVTVVKEMAGAASAQSQVANRYWIALPFGLGPIDPGSFYLAMFGLLVVIMIAFASAHAQQVRVQRLAHRRLDRPSVIRLAPLARLFRGLDSFYGSPGKVPGWRKRGSALYYVLLKAASLIVYFGFPGAALWLTFMRAETHGWLSVGLFAAGTISTVSLVHVLGVDIVYLREVKDIIVESKVPPGSAGRDAS